MKKKKSTLSVFLLLSIMIFVLSACGGEEKKPEYSENTVKQVTQNVLALMQKSVNPNMADSIAAADEEDLKAFEQEIASMGLNIEGEAFKNGYSSYTAAVKGDLGEIVSTEDSPRITADEEGIISDITVTGTKTFPDGSPRTGNVEIMMTRRGKVTSVVYNVNRTFGEKIENAALNTVLGMGTTFCLLIFISIVIWIMGTIVQGMENKKSKADKETAADHVVSQIEKREEQQQAVDKTDDGALIAVISAAVASILSEETGRTVTPDTFIVRSIKRH